MEELKKINSKIAVKQIGRIVGGSWFLGWYWSQDTCIRKESQIVK